LSAIIRGFKGAATKSLKIYATQHQTTDLPNKIWQRNYYERVIRDESELNRVKKYILDNPKNYERKMKMRHSLNVHTTFI
jgi:putative transposase